MIQMKHENNMILHMDIKTAFGTPEDIYTSNHKTTESTSWGGNVRSVIIKSIQSMEYPHIYLTIIKRPIIKIM